MKTMDDVLEDLMRDGILNTAQRKAIYKMAVQQAKMGPGVVRTEEKPKKKTPSVLRKQYPALQDAWDQYRMVLKLVEQEDLEK